MWTSRNEKLIDKNKKKKGLNSGTHDWHLSYDVEAPCCQIITILECCIKFVIFSYRLINWILIIKMLFLVICCHLKYCIVSWYTIHTGGHSFLQLLLEVLHKAPRLYILLIITYNYFRHHITPLYEYGNFLGLHQADVFFFFSGSKPALLSALIKKNRKMVAQKKQEKTKKNNNHTQLTVTKHRRKIK